MDTNPARLELITFFIAMLVIYQLSVATTIFAAASPVGPIRVGNSSSVPNAIVYNPANKMMYVDTAENSVAVINSSNNVVGNIQVFPPHNGEIDHIIYNPTNNMIYVDNFFNGTVSIIDPSTNHVVGNIRVPQPGAIAYNPANNMIYVVNHNQNTVSIIDPSTNHVVGNIRVPQPGAIAYNPANNMIYVVTGEDWICTQGVVSIIDPSTNHVVGNITDLSSFFLSGPIFVREMTYVPRNNMIYLAGHGIRSPEIVNCPFEGQDVISVINSSKNRMVDTIDVRGSHGVVYDSINNMIYTLNWAHAASIGPVVSIIDPSTNDVVDNIRLPNAIRFPSAIAYNPANNMIYITTENESLFAIKPPTGLSQNITSS